MKNKRLATDSQMTQKTKNRKLCLLFNDQSGAADINNLRVTVKEREQESSTAKDQYGCSCGDDGIFNQCLQRNFCIAGTSEDCRFEVIQKDDRQSEQVNADIQKCVRKNIIRNIQQCQKISDK